MKRKIILSLCASFILYSCTDDDVLDRSLQDSSDNLGIEVVEVSGGNVVCGTRAQQKGQLALKFDSETSFAKFKSALLYESSLERTLSVSKYGVENLYDLADEADDELELIGDNVSTIAEFKARYADYKQKYAGLLVVDSSDSTDLSLYVPKDNAIESYIANKEGYYVVGNEVRKINVSSDDTQSKHIAKVKLAASQEGTIAGTNKIIFRPASGKKIYFEAYAQDAYIRVKMSAKKHMWYGWKNDPHRQYFFDSYLNNFVYLAQGKYGQDVVVDRLPRYIFNSSVKNGFDIILGKRQTSNKVTGEFHVWCDYTSEHDKNGNDITEKVGDFVMPKCLESKAQIVKVEIQ